MKGCKDGMRSSKDKAIIHLWNYLNTYIDNNLRQTKTWGERSRIVDFYCKGKGIEIGASCYPVPIYNQEIKVQYLDHIDRNVTHDMKAGKGLQYVKVDIIDDVERLDKIKARTLDFIIMCHVLEHTRNPIGIIENCLSKLKCGGKLVITIPDKRFIFDKNRPLTTWEHLVDDYREINDEKDLQHMIEYLIMSNEYDEKFAYEEAKKRIQADYRPHYHVWDMNSFYDFLNRINGVIKEKSLIIHYSQNKLNQGRSGREIIAVLEKVRKE